jgi:RNase H-fold protein (predicted Holliday junction resolvase)
MKLSRTFSSLLYFNVEGLLVRRRRKNRKKCEGFVEQFRVDFRLLLKIYKKKKTQFNPIKEFVVGFSMKKKKVEKNDRRKNSRELNSTLERWWWMEGEKK